MIAIIINKGCQLEYMVDERLDDILTVKGFGNLYVFGDILVVVKVKETWSNIWL